MAAARVGHAKTKRILRITQEVDSLDLSLRYSMKSLIDWQAEVNDGPCSMNSIVKVVYVIGVVSMETVA